VIKIDKCVNGYVVVFTSTRWGLLTDEQKFVAKTADEVVVIIRELLVNNKLSSKGGD
jgi:hypothetical protein